MYENGYGVPKDDGQAYAWFNLAAAQGEESAKEVREHLKKYMTPSQIADGMRLSREIAASGGSSP